MSTSEITAGKKIDFSGIQVASGTCNSAVTVSEWDVYYVGGQLQVHAQVTPNSGTDGVVALTVLGQAPNGGATFCSATASAFGAGGTAGETIGVLAVTELFDPGVNGTTVQSIVWGQLLQQSGTCFFRFDQTFTVG
jgi:hypothetical protein